MFDLLETRLSALGIVCEHESGKLQFTLTDKGLSVDIMVTRPHGATLLFQASPMLADDLLTHSRYVSRYHEFFYGLSAKGTGVFYLPKAHGQLVPVVCLLSGDEVPSPTLLKTVLHKLGVASFQLATAGPCLLAYGSAEWRSADDIQDWLYQRANPPLVDRQAALIELLMQPEGRWILERMISDKFEPYKALIDQVLFEAWSPPSTSGEGATFPKLGSSGD